MNHTQPPIGYILKELDRTLTTYTDKALQKHHLSRLHWQILNVVDESNKDFQQILSIMKIFIDEPQLTTLLKALQDYNWIEAIDGIYKMTTVGKEKLHLAAQSQNDVRKQLVKDVSQEEYTAVLSILQKMLRNISS